MKLFLDTNIFIEYFENRLQSNLVGQVFDTIEEGVVEAVTSTGGFYTMTYLLTNALNRNNIHKPEQTKRLRTILRDYTHVESNNIEILTPEQFIEKYL